YKRLLGFSSVSQIGYIMLGFGIGNYYGVHLPLNATVAHGLLESGFEFRGFAGYSGWNTGGIGIAMGKAITKTDYKIDYVAHLYLLRNSLRNY
ncbi:unnamed protein product, partial [marine sediment metagenome]